MIYIDTSSLLKLVITDRFSTFVELAIASEPVVIVSSLGELETRVQLRGLAKGGIIRTSRIQRIGEKLALNLKSAPFVIRSLSGDVFATALIQHEIAKSHCRSLDRLHLAAMEELRISRLMTHDARQAEAARELGSEVISPGR